MRHASDEAKSGGAERQAVCGGVGAGRSMDEKTGQTWELVWIGGLLRLQVSRGHSFGVSRLFRRDAFRCPVWHRVMGWLREWGAEALKSGRCERRESGPLGKHRRVGFFRAHPEIYSRDFDAVLLDPRSMQEAHAMPRPQHKQVLLPAH